MRYDPDKPYKIWHCDVRKATVEALEALLPIDGARVWTVQTALNKFLDRVEPDEELQRWIHHDVQEMLVNRDTPRGLIPINVRVTTESFARFNKIFPEWGAGTWVLRNLLNAVVDIMQEENFMLEEKIERAVNRALTPPTTEV